MDSLTPNKVKRQVHYDQLSLKLIPSEHLGGILKIWFYFYDNAEALQMKEEFTPYMLYQAFNCEDGQKHIDLIHSLGQTIMFTAWDVCVRQNKKKSIFTDKGRGRQVGVYHQPLLSLFRQATEDDDDSLDQLLYYNWQYVYEQLINSKQISELQSIDDDIDTDESTFQDESTQDEKSQPQSKNNLNQYFESFQEKSMQEKIEYFLDMLYRTSGTIQKYKTKQNQEIAKNQPNSKELKQEIQAKYELKKQDKLKVQQIKALHKKEEEYYFQGHNILCLGNTYQNKFTYYMYKEFPNYLFKFDLQDKVEILEGPSGLIDVKIMLDSSHLCEKQLLGNIKDMYKFESFFHSSLEQDNLSEEEINELNEKTNSLLFDKDFVKLKNPMIDTFIQNRKKQPITLDMIKDFLISSEQIFQEFSQTFYQSRWAKKSVRQEFTQEILDCNCSKLLAKHLHNLVINLSTTQSIFIGEKPNFRAFVPEMEFDELEEMDEDKLEYLPEKTMVFWKPDEQDYREAWFKQVQRTKYSGNIQSLFFLPITSSTQQTGSQTAEKTNLLNSEMPVQNRSRKKKDKKKSRKQK